MASRMIHTMKRECNKNAEDAGLGDNMDAVHLIF